MSCPSIAVAAILAAGGFLLSLARKISNGELAKERLPGLLWGGSGLALAAGFAITVTMNDGLANRRPDGERQLGVYSMAAADWTFPSECLGTDLLGNVRPCQLGPASGRGVLFIGDSFAAQIFSRFVENAKLNPENSFTFLVSSGCPPITGIRMVFARLHCNGFVEKALHFAEARNFKRIVLVSKWYDFFRAPDPNVCFIEGDTCTLSQDPSLYFQHLDAALASFGSRLLEFRKHGAEVVIIGATPWGDWDVPLEFAKRKFWGMDTKDIEYIDRDEFEQNADPLKSRLVSLAASIGAKFVDPLDFLCDDHRCPATDDDGVPLYFDQSHFRSGAVKTSRFQFLDDATGVDRRLSAAPMPQANIP